MRRLSVALCLLAVACGSSSPTTPTEPPPTATPTRIIKIGGGPANFGNIDVGSSATWPLQIINEGNSPLTVTGLSSAFGGTFTSTFTSGVVQPGAAASFQIRFSPTNAQLYNTTMVVASDATSGTNSTPINAVGLGPVVNITRTGDMVYDLPNYVSRVTVTGRYTGFSSNFIMRIGGRLIVNELLGTGWSSTTFSGTYQLQTAGGTVEVTSSSGVTWTLTELR